MKTTIDLPDQLMDEVKTLAAREHRKVGEVVAELVRLGLDNRTHPLPQEVSTFPRSNGCLTG